MTGGNMIQPYSHGLWMQKRRYCFMAKRSVQRIMFSNIEKKEATLRIQRVKTDCFIIGVYQMDNVTSCFMAP
jgi:hypothetical protein